MEISKHLSQTRLERNLVRLLPAGLDGRPDAGFGFDNKACLTPLPLPPGFGQGQIQPMQIRPDLRAIVIQCRAGSEARFACRIQTDLCLAGYARHSHSRIRVDDRRLPDSNGDGWLLRLSRGSRFEWTAGPGQNIHEIIFFPSADWMEPAGVTPDDPPDQSHLLWRRFGESRIDLLVDRLFEVVATPGPESAALGMLAFAWMAAALAGGAESPATGTNAPNVPCDELRKIQQARAILFAEFLNPPTTVRLAKRVALNEFKLKRGYRQTFGNSIYGDLRRHRMHVARDLLIAGESSVAAAACAVGYSNPGHFARAFQQEFGMAPGQLSRRNRRQWIVNETPASAGQSPSSIPLY